MAAIVAGLFREAAVAVRLRLAGSNYMVGFYFLLVFRLLRFLGQRRECCLFFDKRCRRISGFLSFGLLLLSYECSTGVFLACAEFFHLRSFRGVGEEAVSAVAWMSRTGGFNAGGWSVGVTEG